MAQHIFSLVVIWSSFVILSAATVGDELSVEPDGENVVGSRLVGNWQLDKSLTARLTGDGASRAAKLSFRSDPKITTMVPDKYKKVFTERKMKIYLAGYVQLDDEECPFVLTQVSGNPHVIFWVKRDDDPFGNGESFNVMLAVGENRKKDLLFVGGDFNNQPFAAFERDKMLQP